MLQPSQALIWHTRLKSLLRIKPVLFITSTEVRENTWTVCIFMFWGGWCDNLYHSVLLSLWRLAAEWMKSLLWAVFSQRVKVYVFGLLVIMTFILVTVIPRMSLCVETQGSKGTQNIIYQTWTGKLLSLLWASSAWQKIHYIKISALTLNPFVFLVPLETAKTLLVSFHSQFGRVTETLFSCWLLFELWANLSRWNLLSCL